MARALAGDHHAFASLFRRHAADVHAFAQRRTRSADIADDVVAVAFEKAWRSLGTLGAAHGDRFRPWIFRIAANEMASLYRAGSRRARREHLAAVRGEIAVEGHTNTLDEHRPSAESPAAGSAVLAALATLSDQHQEVISLRYLADLDPAETARALDLSKSHVAVRLHRAMAALRSALADLDPDGGAA